REKSRYVCKGPKGPYTRIDFLQCAVQSTTSCSHITTCVYSLFHTTRPWSLTAGYLSRPPLSPRRPSDAGTMKCRGRREMCMACYGCIHTSRPFAVSS
ncbi:hypothetical protein SK128_014104, partial [Halocaridina rubra]